MSLQYYLRLAWVGLTLSVVVCLPEVSGDVTGDSKSQIQELESVNPPIQNPTRDNFQRKTEQFNGKAQLPWISSTLYNQRKKFNEETDAKGSYVFQTVQQEQNPFKESQMNFSDINLAPRLLRKKGGMHAANVHRSGSFGYQSIFKSEMHSDSSRPLGLNEPYMRENIPTNYMSRSATVNHNIRHKSDGNVLFDNFLQNNGQNQNVLRRVVPANTFPSIATVNQHEGKPSPQAFSAGTGGISQMSYENMRDVALSKVFKPPTILTPVSPAFKRPNSNGVHSTLPIKKSKLFSSPRDHVKLSNSERVANPKASLQSGVEHGNAKLATSRYNFKNIQLAQNGYQNRGQSGQNVVSVETFRNQKYDNLASGISAIKPPVTNNARFYFQSYEKGGIQLSEPLKRSGQNTDLPPRMQFTKKAMLISERDKNINLPDPTNHSLRRPSKQNAQNRTLLNSFGQSTVQSLSFKHHHAPGFVQGNAMKSHVPSVSPSVFGTEGAFKNSGKSSSRNEPYYLTSKKPYAFKGFTFVPELPKQKSKMHSDQRPLLESSSNVEYAPAHPHTAQSALAQKPFTRESSKKTLFQFKDTESSQKNPLYRDQTDSFKNGPPRDTISSIEGVSNPMPDALKHHVVRGQAAAMKTSLFATNATNNGAVDKVQSKTSHWWTSSRLASAQPAESNKDAFPTVRNGSFVGSNLNKASITSSSRHKGPTSKLILPIHKSSLMNKVTGYAKIQPLHSNSLKGHENSAGTPQTYTAEKLSPIRMKPTSSVVIGRQVKDNSNHQKVYAIPTSHSAIYRSADVNHHKTNNSAKFTFQSPIHRSAVKPSGKANILQANASDWRTGTSQISEADINLSAVGVSQALRPTSSFVVGKYINKFDRTPTKSNLNTYSTKSGLNDYKSLQFSDIVGSASFTDVKFYSESTTASEEVDLESDQNATNSMEESFKELFFDNSSMISALQNEMNESAVDIRVPEFMPATAIDFTTLSSQLSSLLTKEPTQPQPTVRSSESQPDPGNHSPSTPEGTIIIHETTLIPNTTLQDKMTSG
ncbi:uncharacterized protein LOC122348040 [Puntigrus tetrazona]|uniref:uncharacterized protein LOC122348040 n=1 Tax=Puntigrus tetrazona TaxID=1606681 RepID=UPI001C894064|nr:uncharacterized protein LOC122348040 [Puntigrus tetrazona]